MKIGLCQIEEVAQLLPLMAQLGYGVTQTDLERRFKRFMACQGYGVAVAYHKDKIAGLIAWSTSELFISDATRFHIEALVVDKEVRGQGIGEKLINFLENIAKKQAPAIIDLTSGAKRAKEGTHLFYEKRGYHNKGELEKVYLRKMIYPKP